VAGVRFPASLTLYFDLRNVEKPRASIDIIDSLHFSTLNIFYMQK